MKRQGGFTLIELVVVIVILGILAVTAAPKFLNLQSDARASSLQGLKGAMSGASGIVYGKAAIEGVEQLSGQTVDNIAVEFGYPDATVDGIGAAVIGLTDDWSSAVVSGGGSLIVGFQVASASEDTISATNCFVTYNAATTVSSGISTVITDNGC